MRKAFLCVLIVLLAFQVSHAYKSPFSDVHPNSSVFQDLTILYKKIFSEELQIGCKGLSRYEAAIIVARALERFPSCNFLVTNNAEKCQEELNNLLKKNIYSDKELKELTWIFDRLEKEFWYEFTVLGVPVSSVPLCKKPDTYQGYIQKASRKSPSDNYSNNLWVESITFFKARRRVGIKNYAEQHSILFQNIFDVSNSYLFKKHKGCGCSLLPWFACW